MVTRRSDPIADTTEQDFLSDCRNVRAVQVQDITGNQTAPTAEAVRASVKPVPLIGSAWSVEPHRVIEAGALELESISRVVSEVWVRRPSST